VEISPTVPVLAPGGGADRQWFGRRGKIVRHDSRWQVADTHLPFDPRALEPVS